MIFCTHWSWYRADSKGDRNRSSSHRTFTLRFGVFFDDIAFDPKKAKGRFDSPAPKCWSTSSFHDSFQFFAKKRRMSYCNPRQRRDDFQKTKWSEVKSTLLLPDSLATCPRDFTGNRFIQILSSDRSEKPPIFKSKLTIDDFVAWDHILISPQGDLKSVIDAALAGRSRRIVAGISNFLTPGWIVANSDVLLTAPSKLISVFEETLSVKSFNLPIESPNIHVVQVWHERLHRSPLHKWFRHIL